MIRWIRWRRARKHARDMLRHARHVRYMREDVAPAERLARLDAAVRAAREALRKRATAELEQRLDALGEAVQGVAPPPRYPVIREYVEIAAVALSVAMGFRTYFLQPFKIPTGSMQPTLYGIHYEPRAAADLTDAIPLKAVKWLITGEWYTEVRARASGTVGLMTPDRLEGPPIRDGVLQCPVLIAVGGQMHQGFAKMAIRVVPGQRVEAGQVLASGARIAGDHVFVDRVSWNFRRPRRSEVTVFLTNGIEGLRANWNKHYIKRTVGLPGETVSVQPPWVRIDGEPVEAHTIGRIARNELGNGGYRLAEGASSAVLGAAGQSHKLGEDEYLAMGDNTLSSFDGRYWGGVRRPNLVGPACCVYWPVTRWRIIRR